MMIEFLRICVSIARRLPASIAAVLTFFVIFACSQGALAGVTIGNANSSGSSGAVPGFAGTGLSGSYYNYGITSDPLATFTTTNLCYPTCFAVNPYDGGGDVFDDGSGGLVAVTGPDLDDNGNPVVHPGFTNGHIDNVIFNPNFTAPTNWTYSNLTFNGYIAITQPGTYLFSLGSDDYSTLEIAGQTILNIPYPPCCATKTEDVTFSAAGLYAIAVQFGEYDGGSFLSLIATTDDTNLTPACLFGCVDGNGTLAANGLFYSDGQLEGAPAPTIGGGWSGIAALAVIAMGAAVRRYRRIAAA